jgi:large subunit ribosomal protein L17
VRHRLAGRRLSADTQHRLALRRNLARALFLSDRIVTTHAKAKYVRRSVERLITRAKKALVAKAAGEASAYLHHVRVIARDVHDKAVLRRLLAEIAPAAKDRPGGYTRIVRDWKNQVGDNAPRAILELVDRPAAPEEPAEDAPAKEGKARGKKPARAEGAEKAEKPAKAARPAKAKAAKGGGKAKAAPAKDAADDDE